MDLVNKDIPNDSPDHFDNISSVYLPVTKDGKGYKERYLFLYKHNKVTVTDSFQYDEGKAGDFNRPPFVVQFSSTQTAVKDFVLIPIHTKPDHAVKEIDALVDVVEAAEQKWKNNKNIVVLGDFNAGVRYVGTDDWKKIPLLTNKKFHSLIENVATTLAEETIQTHDRIVVTTEMYNAVVPNSAKVFDFKKAYGLEEPEKAPQALAVSNHFPVEVELRSRNQKRNRSSG
ncbi:deoxyribonuclease-1-like [Pseudochaenichthys georgianus]|uniref:deoxyribonuclease-1-like n=1 Tax=Pseudochaenichthys georgianus TaxID=52239 RepID=UPI00146DEC01|nr:deoxyribonuclease-1-like [Pseudochaenichthys georgianus]